MTNLLDGIKGHLSNALLDQVSNTLGESQSGVSQALNGLIPTILGGMVNKADSNSGFGQIFDLIKTQGNTDILSNLGSLVGGGNLAHNDPKDIGGQLMGSLFGNNVGNIISSVASMAGLKSRSSASSLLGLAAPLVMGFLKKKILGDNLSASGLASMLLGQKKSIFNAIPAGMTNALGFSVPKFETPNVSSAAKAGGSIWKWLLPLLLLGALAFYFLRGCNPEQAMSDASATVENAAGAVSDAASDAANAVGDAAGAVGDAAGNAVDAVASMFKRTLPGGVEIEGASDGIESQLIDFVEGDAAVDKTTWFNFDALRFKTGSAELDMDYSGRQINNLVAIMKAFPDLHLKIGGYTDSDGSDELNQKLSQNRADNVMKAVVANGIDADRLAAEGYGEAHPLCPANDTPECKAQNRRIAVRVTAK